MERETITTARRISSWASACSAAALVLAVGTAWVPVATAADTTAVGSPNQVTSVIVDRFPQPIDSTDVMYHAGQYVQYRVRAYDANGNIIPCNANGVPQLVIHNPVGGTSQVIGQARGLGPFADKSAALGMVMGPAGGGGNVEVSCNGVMKRVIVQSDGEPLQPDQQPANNKLIQQAGMGPPPTLQVGAPGSDLQPQQTEQQTGGGEESSSGSGVGAALLITGAVVLTAVVVAVAVSGAGGGGGSCKSGSHQCSPPNASVCCPDGTTIYCSNNGTCTNQTLSNFGDICGSGNNSTAIGC